MHIFAVIILIIFLLVALSITYAYYLIDYNSYIDFSNIHDIAYPPRRVAILLSGQVRAGYVGCLWSQIINIIYPLQADVFFCFDNNLDKRDKKKVIDLLKPKAYTWNSRVAKNNEFIEKNLEYMFSRIYECNKTKQNYENENKIKYDIVIRSRPDIIIKEKIPLMIIENIQRNSIYYPSINKYDALTSNRFFGATDQFALGDSDSMDTYANAYNFIYPYYVDLLKSKKVACPSSESILQYYLKTKNIKTVNYYQKFLLHDKRLNNNMHNAINDYFKKMKYYPLVKCYNQNNN